MSFFPPRSVEHGLKFLKTYGLKLWLSAKLIFHDLPIFDWQSCQVDLGPQLEAGGRGFNIGDLWPSHTIIPKNMSLLVFNIMATYTNARYVTNIIQYPFCIPWQCQHPATIMCSQDESAKILKLVQGQQHFGWCSENFWMKLTKLPILRNIGGYHGIPDMVLFNLPFLKST